MRVRIWSGGNKRMHCHLLLDAKPETVPSEGYLEAIRKAHEKIGFQLRVPGYESTKIPVTPRRPPSQRPPAPNT
jgi:hypothetical protein